MTDPRLVDYVLSRLGRRPRSKIEGRLLAEGVSRDEVEAAFRTALRRRALKFAGLMAALAAALVAIKVTAPRPGGPSREAQRRWESVESFQPKPYRPLTLLQRYLPARLEEGDAARDYLEAAQGAASGRGGLLSKVEAGARKRDCRLSGVLLNPSDAREAAGLAPKAASIALLAGVFVERAKALSKAGRAREAEAELRLAMNVGRHLAEDWDPSAQLMGAALITSSALRWTGGGGSVSRAMMLKELEASLPKPAEIGLILDSAMDPARLGALSRYLKEERLRRPYALLALQAAALLWAPPELAAARPSAARRELIESAAKSPDERLAASGKAYLSVLGSVERGLRTVPPERRGDRVAGEWLRLRRLAEAPIR
ncbi:MAG TPA: hypothetical protein DCM05_11165 [Elusimicrobia bacterium]|nr:hypothetical protein [Elusimicrobiota bacterium]